jgi:quercetin dioxygenase-like cupin family protein
MKLKLLMEQEANTLRINQSLLLKPGETRCAGPLNIFGDLVFVKIGGGDTDGNYAIMETVTPPQGGPPLHRHGREDESFYVLEGICV